MDWLGISMLYLLALILLLGDIFLPSHGILTIASLIFWALALFMTFRLDTTAGYAATLAVMVLVPAILVVTVKNWHRTPVGRRISPPNPVLTEADRMPVEQLERMIGTVGRTVTPLRPVGTAVFDGQRVECCAEYGMLPANAAVEGVRLSDRTLVVRPLAEPA